MLRSGELLGAHRDELFDLDGEHPRFDVPLKRVKKRRVIRYGKLRGRAPLPAASGDKRCRRADNQSDRLYAAVLFLSHLGCREIVEHTCAIHEPRTLPVVLSAEEVSRLLDAAPGLKYKAALSVAYGAGLRAAEVVSLKVSDIDTPMIVPVSSRRAKRDRRRGRQIC